MLVGTYYHTLESKGRFSLPRAFRSESDSWVVTAGLDGCIFIFQPAQWESEAKQLTELSYYQADHRALIRHFAAHASQQQPDNLGRLTLSEDLRRYGELDRQLVIVGALTRIEVWDQAKYERFFDNLAQTVETKSEQVLVDQKE
jgi:MraZ protein